MLVVVVDAQFIVLPPVQGLRESSSFTGSFERLIPPCSPLRWFSSWQYARIRVPLCPRLIHEGGFRIHFFCSGGTVSPLLKSKSKGFTHFTGWYELKYFLDSSLVPLHHHYDTFPAIFCYYVYFFVNFRRLHIHHVLGDTFSDLTKSSGRIFVVWFGFPSVKLTWFALRRFLSNF